MRTRGGSRANGRTREELPENLVNGDEREVAKLRSLVSPKKKDFGELTLGGDVDFNRPI
jgi:hypothetical protein